MRQVCNLGKFTVSYLDLGTSTDEVFGMCPTRKFDVELSYNGKVMTLPLYFHENGSLVNQQTLLLELDSVISFGAGRGDQTLALSAFADEEHYNEFKEYCSTVVDDFIKLVGSRNRESTENAIYQLSSEILGLQT